MYVIAPQPSHLYNRTPFDPVPTSSVASSARSRDLANHGFSKRTLIIMAAALSGAVLFVIIFAALHCIRRYRRSAQQKQEQQDIEKSLRRAEIVRLVRDSDLPARPNEMQRSASTSRVPVRTVDDDEPPLPALLPIRTAPPIFQTFEALSPVERVRGPTRNPLGSHAPGVGGRVANRVRQLVVQKPVQIYDPQRRRKIYLG